MQLSDDRQSRDEGLHGRTQLWAREDAYVNRRHRRPRHTHTLDRNVKSESRARKAGECREGDRAVPTNQDLNVVWLTESEASPITEHKDDPEKESTQSDEVTSEKMWNTFQQQSSMTQKAELQLS